MYLGQADPQSGGEGIAETVKANWTLVMPLLPLCFPSLSHHGLLGLRGAGAPGSYWVRCPGTVSPSFPSEEAAAAAAAKSVAAPALRVYIFFIKSSGIVNLFFKTKRERALYHM